jgi:nucleoside phosphorylase
MIDINNPGQFDALMLRVQARRVAQACQGAGRMIPPKAAAILVGDTEEAVERDGEAFAAWCAARGVECIAVLGISDFRPS